MKMTEAPGKDVAVTVIDGRIFEGHCSAYNRAEENMFNDEVNKASIYIDRSTICFEIYEEEILKIEEIQST